MRVTDPHELLAAIDLEIWNKLRGVKSSEEEKIPDGPQYMEPCGGHDSSLKDPQGVQGPADVGHLASENAATAVMTGKVQTLGDFIDTDAVWKIPFQCDLLGIFNTNRSN